MDAISPKSHVNPDSGMQPSDNEVRLWSFMEASLAVTLTLDENFGITYANPRTTELFGYEPEELIGRPFFETFAISDDENGKKTSSTPMDSFGGQRSSILEEFRNPKTQHVQSICVGLRKNGTKTWLSWKFMPRRDDQDKITEIYCVGNDLTDKKEAVLRSQLNDQGVDAGYWNVNVKTGEIVAGSRWFTIRGLNSSPEKINIKLWFEDIHTQDYPTVRRYWKKHLRDQDPAFFAEFRFLNHQKGWIWIRSTGRVSEWDEQGQPLWISGFDLDITQERLNAESLKNKHSLLKEVIQVGRMGYYVFDYNINNTAAVSDTLYEILGIDRQSVTYESFFEYFEMLIHAEDRHRVFETMFSSGTMERKTECRILTNMGTMIYAQIHSRPIVDSAGQVAAQITIIQDITESKKVEYTLREQQWSLFYALKVSHAGFWQFHLETGALEVSNDTRDFFSDLDVGAPTSFEKMIKNWIYPGDLQWVWEILSRAVTAGGTFEFECRIIDRMKNVRYVRQSGVVRCDEDQSATKIFGVVLDISDLIQREKEIQESEARYRILFDHSFDAVAVFENKKIVQCNERAVELFHASGKTDLVGQNASVLFPKTQPDGHFSMEVFYDLLYQCTRFNVSPFTMNAQRLDGQEFIASVSLSPVSEDESLVFAMIRDITEQKIVTKTMEYYRAYLAILAELRDQYYGRSEQETIAAFLGGVTKHFGISKTWYGIYKHNSILPMLHAGESQKFIDVASVALFDKPKDREFPLSKAIRERKAIIVNRTDDTTQTEPLVSFLRKTNFRSVLAVPLEVNDTLEGGFVFYSHESGLFEDFVSNYLQTGIRELSRILYEKRRWEKHQRMLEQAKETAETAANTKTQFLANMSHEIRTPMTAILGYSEMLSEKPDSPEELTKIARTIKNNASFLLHILNDILDFSKIEANKILLEHQEISLQQILADIYAPYFVVAEKKHVTLEITNATEFPQSILSDPVRIKQVLLNLVANALKFTYHGGVKVVVSWEGNHAPHDTNEKVGVFSRDIAYESCLLLGDFPGKQCDGFLRFEIFDTGIGITPEQLNMIFSPFNQADTSTTRQFGGTGLGLAISQRLTVLLGGQMAVASTPGLGSVFAIVLPMNIPQGTKFLETLNLGDPLQDDGVMTPQETMLNWETKNRNGILPPATREPLTPQSEKQKSNTKLLTGIRVLLAEDGIDNQRLFSLILSKAGAEVTLVDNGAAVVEMFQNDATGEKCFDIVLMDIQMPIMDGYTATRKLRNQGCTIPIVALTAHAMIEERSKCLDAGCNDYATKPIMKDALIRVVFQNTRKDDTE